MSRTLEIWMIIWDFLLRRACIKFRNNSKLYFSGVDGKVNILKREKNK